MMTLANYRSRRNMWLKYRVIFKITLLVFKILHGLGPSYLENLIWVKPEGHYHLRNKDHLSVPKTKCKTFEDRAFFTSGPILWNSLRGNIREIANLQKLKKELKTFLFRLAYQWASVVYIQRMIFYTLFRLINIFLIIYIRFQLKYFYCNIILGTVEPRLSGPRLSEFLDYPDFFCGPNMVMNIYYSPSRSVAISFLKLQHWKVQSNARVFLLSESKSSALALVVNKEEHSNESWLA